MKNFLLAFLFSFAFPVAVWATHIVGGSLTYEHLGGSTYRVTLKLYRDCGSGNAAFPANVRIEVRQPNGTSFTPDKDIIIPFPGATQLQPQIDTCAVNPGICVEEAIYSRVVNNLPRTQEATIFFTSYAAATQAFRTYRTRLARANRGTRIFPITPLILPTAAHRG